MQKDDGVDVALDAMQGVEVAALRQKSLALTELFMARVGALLPGLDIVTPRQPSLPFSNSASTLGSVSQSIIII